MMKKDFVKSEIEIRGVLGAATPYRHGGSLRITLPKRVAKHYMLNPSRGMDEEEITLVFIETDQGILIRPLKEPPDRPSYLLTK